MVRAKPPPGGRALSTKPTPLHPTIPAPANTGGVRMVTRVVANDTDRSVHDSFPPPALAAAPDANLNRTNGDVLIKAVRARDAGTLVVPALQAAAQIITPRTGMRALNSPNGLSK